MSTKPYTKKTFSTVGCGRMFQEREKLNKEVKEEESKSGKREVEGERERVEIGILRMCLDHLSREEECWDS